MAKPVKLKCLHCGHEYVPGPAEDPEKEERTCPRCRSNSVRLISTEPPARD